MAIILGLALALVLVGLVCCALCKYVGGTLGQIVYWVGVVLIVVGLILLLAPIISWVAAQIHAALGQ